MHKSRYLSLAHQASGITVGVLSLALILLPQVRIQASYLGLTAAAIVYVILGIYVDRLQGLTLKMLHAEIKDGRRAPMSNWNFVALILMLAALFFTEPGVS